MQKDPYLTPCEKFNYKEDTLSEIEDKIGNSPEHICSGKDFLNRTLRTLAQRTTNTWAHKI